MAFSVSVLCWLFEDEHRERKENAMNEFISKYESQIGSHRWKWTALDASSRDPEPGRKPRAEGHHKARVCQTRAPCCALQAPVDPEDDPREEGRQSAPESHQAEG
jgi:hypothetical protein